MQQIGGYQPLERLGEGGSGVVFRALSPEGTEVALKVLHPAVAANSQARVRLQREVATINRLQIPSVVRVLDVELDGEPPFIVTELVRGFNLRAEVTKQGPWGREDLADLAERLFETVSAMHNVGVLHRDLKPSNVMLAASGPVLVDFGTAQIESDERITQTGLVTGTPGFVSPEVLTGSPPDRASDWWAWAATLLFCATGRAPFAGANSYAILQQVLNSQPDLAGLDDAMQYGFARALARDPAARSTPQQLIAQLNAQPGVILPVALELDEAATAAAAAADATHELAGTNEADAATRILDNAHAVAEPADPAATVVQATTAADDAVTRIVAAPEVGDENAVAGTQVLASPAEAATEVHGLELPSADAAGNTVAQTIALPEQADYNAYTLDPPTAIYPQQAEYSQPGPNAPSGYPAAGSDAAGAAVAMPEQYPPQQQYPPQLQQPESLDAAAAAQQQWRKPRMHPFLAAALIALAAAFTLKLGLVVSGIFGACLLLAYLVGAQRKRRYRAQINGGLTIFGFPFDLIKGVLGILFAAIGWAVALVIVLYSSGVIEQLQLVNGDFTGFYRQLLQRIAAMPAYLHFGVIFAWYSLVAITPGLGSLRGGWRASVDTLMRPRWLRVLVTISALTIAMAAAYSTGVI